MKCKVSAAQRAALLKLATNAAQRAIQAAMMEAEDSPTWACDTIHITITHPFMGNIVCSGKDDLYGDQENHPLWTLDFDPPVVMQMHVSILPSGEVTLGKNGIIPL